MDKTAIKNFAVWARKKLIEDIKQKAYEIGITEKEIKEPKVTTSDTMIIGDRTLNKAEMEQRKSLVSRIREKGFNNVIEEVAYTWFNRILALRFMEVNEYLPTGVRVLSSIESGKKEPDIIKEALNTDLDLDRELVYMLQDDNDTEGLYRYLLVKQCNALNEILPGLFEEIEDYTEILLPSNLLAEGSVIRQLIDSIPEEDFKDQVEIIGWMYQYYITETNELVYDGSMSKSKIPKELLPAATQIFTPDWVVKYMVENSLGRLWLEGHRDSDIKSKWRYYLVTQHKNDEKISEVNVNIRPEEIKIIDPAMGSGHILVYAFDVLYDTYKSAGYSERDIPSLILENNLYGLDIDDRVAQLAYFAVMMKARSKSRRIFREKVNINVCSIQESNGFPKEAIDYLINPQETEIEKRIRREDVEYLINVFHDAKEYGSILEVKPIDFDAIEERLEEIRNGGTEDLFEYQYRNIILERIPALVKQARIMSQKYDIVITNPPYLNSSRMNPRLLDYVVEKFPDNKSDFSMIFFQKAMDDFCRKDGYISFITTTSWMFLKSFEFIRKKAIENLEFETLVDFGTELFEGKVGHNPIVAWVNKNSTPTKKMFAIRLSEYCYSRRDEKEKEFFNEKNRYITNQKGFTKIPGMPIAYWASERLKQIYDNSPLLLSIAEPKQGLATADNNRFLRLWYEIDNNKIGYKIESREKAKLSDFKWFPYNKGDAFRKWYGNIEYLINWYNDGKELFAFKGSVLRNHQYYFRECISWSKVTSGGFSVRYIPKGFLFDVAGCSIFLKKDKLLYLLGFLNSPSCMKALSLLSQTLNFEVGHIANLPVIINNDYKPRIDGIVTRNIEISKIDWDSFETSWDFQRHPLLTHKGNSITIEQAFNNWSAFTEKQFNQLKANEEELNRIFIEIYGLQDELTPEVDDKDVTIRKADRVRDIKSFISYAVGCMFGRYSIDAEGLIYAGGDFKEKWKCENGQWKVRKIVRDEEGKVVEDTWVDATFVPDMDNVLPITNDEYFEDDIVSRFVQFLKVTFGEDTLEENLDYIADAIGRKSSETARQAIRRYFLKEFYKDHVQVYQKKPIYWLFDSGKQDGFKALIYMHRYDEFTVARVRTDYLHKLQKSYEAEFKRLDIIIDSNVSQREKTNARKKKEQILKQMEECLQYDQIIAHVANQRIKIDLDDGVSVNYSKFQGIEVPQGEGRKPLKADLLAKI